jgi:hypothetical protein
MGLMEFLTLGSKITASARTIPLIFNQMNFGKEVDYERWCIAAGMELNSAAIFISDMELNFTRLVKGVYLCFAVVIFTTTRFV